MKVARCEGRTVARQRYVMNRKDWCEKRSGGDEEVDLFDWMGSGSGWRPQRGSLFGKASRRAQGSKRSAARRG